MIPIKQCDCALRVGADLEILARAFIIEHVGDVLCENLLAARARVDSNVCDTNGPRRIA